MLGPTIVLWALAGCADATDHADRALIGSGDAPAAVLATFSQGTVTVDALRQELAHSRGTPASTLAALLRRKLLIAAAARDGFAAPEEVSQAVARDAVRALLRRAVEAEESPAAIAPDALQEAYDRQKDRFQLPERRSVSHLLFAVPADAPEEAWQAAARRAAAASTAGARLDRETTFGRWEATPNASFEDVGTFSRDAPFVAPFIAAAFSTQRAGLVREPVRTSFGVHVLWVREVLPAAAMSFPQVKPQLLEELVMQRRGERMASLLERLRREGQPAYAAGALDRLARGGAWPLDGTTAAESEMPATGVP